MRGKYPSNRESLKDPVIIFIHGLANKPPKELLHKWYRKSIEEGLLTAGYPQRRYRLELVYWADLMYEQPLDPKEKDKKSLFYLDEPYVPFNGKTLVRNKNRRKTLMDRLEDSLEHLFVSRYKWINLDYLFDQVTKRMLKDLYIYYRKSLKPRNSDSEVAARILIRNRLIKRLRRFKHRKVMLVAHSMGSIIAYDVLLHGLPNHAIHTLVTLGSPLGLPMIKREIFKELNMEFDTKIQLPTPRNIKAKWFNLSDVDDSISGDNWLGESYLANSSGVSPVDIEVINTYEHNNIPNAHKSFGYLRAPEMADIINNFLYEEKSLLTRVLKKAKNFFG